MFMLAEIKSRLSHLLLQLADADAMLKQGSAVTSSALDLIARESAAFISKSILGRGTPGRKLAQDLSKERRRTQQQERDHKVRKIIQNVAAEAEGLLASESGLNEIPTITADKWRKKFRSIQSANPSKRTATLLHQAQTTLTEIINYTPKTTQHSRRGGNDFPPG